MLITTPRLKKFIEPVPVCSQTAGIDGVYEIFSQGECDRLVVVSEQQYPLGLVRARCLMPDLIGKVKAQADASIKKRANHPSSYPTRQTARRATGRQDIHALLEPLATLPADFTLSEFSSMVQNQVEAETNRDWALVDRDGKFQGLLDIWRLLKYQASSTEVAGSSTVPLATAADASTEPQPNALHPLVQILEQLPLPLRLQNGAGQVLSQNLTWRQLLGESQDPDLVRREAQKLANKKNNKSRSWQFVQIPLGTPASSGEWAGGESNFSTPLWLVLATDVTQQQQLAKELAAKNAETVQLKRLKDEFLACISHELKTPLTAVVGLSTLLKDRVLGELNERQARYAELIYQSGHQLSIVVNDILDLTRIETGQLELTSEPVSIAAVCDRAYLQAQQLQSVKHKQSGASPLETQFTLEIEPGLEMLVADEVRLHQMLLHLLSNALKFTDDSGEIGLKVSRWSGWIAFTVWDTGIGIPPQKQHLIFQKFQQLENPLTRQFEGTGLGLALTQRLARLHGGDVSFISKPGTGSQFTLLLPPTGPPSSQNEVDDTSPHAQTRFYCANSNRLLLVVEAVPDRIEELNVKLTSFGYRVVIAHSGTEAIEKARRFQPSAVLLNPLLPQLSGWDVFSVLKSSAQTRHIPVLAIGSLADKETACSSQADGFLSLPIQARALRQSLRSLTLQKSRSPAPLMILRLTPNRAGTQPATDSSIKVELKANYRVLEAEDLESAELLARVWHPDVLILDDLGLSDRLTYLQQLSQHASLASLPLVTLNRQTTEAAFQVAGLSVFPCLAPPKSNDAALLQVIQVAAGSCLQPNILVVDVATVPTNSPPSQPLNSHDWLQALI